MNEAVRIEELCFSHSTSGPPSLARVMLSADSGLNPSTVPI
jgi:hypothetical protein